MIRLERLQVYDIEQVVNLSDEFNDLYGVSSKFNKAKARSLFEAAVVYTSRYFCIVMKDDQKVVGFLLGFSSEHSYTDDVLAGEIGWYVQEDYRKTASSVMMLKEFEYWAKEEAKAQYVTMSYTEEMSDLSKLYTRLDYSPAEYTYKKSLK